MLTIHQIQRHFQARHFDLLLRGVSPIGLELAMPLHVRLAGQPAAVVGLALRRVLELTYGPTALSRELTEALLHMQNDDGSFGSGAEANTGDALATAAAVAALTALLHEHASAHPEAAVARERAIAALAAAQGDVGLFNSDFDRTEDERALSSAFILALLAGDDDFRQAVRCADLMTWFDERTGSLGEAVERLCRMAQVDVTTGLPDAWPALAA